MTVRLSHPRKAGCDLVVWPSGVGSLRSAIFHEWRKPDAS
jgi:hypothetical protein